MLNVEMNGYKRIRKNEARRLYDDGATIYLLPCKVYPDDDHPWIKPNELKKRDEYTIGNLFDKHIDAFEYYNCNAELGYYTAFYIKED